MGIRYMKTKVMIMASDIKPVIDERAEDFSPFQSMDESRTVLVLEGMTCASCAMRIEKGLKKVPGVRDASVNFATEQATVTYDSEQTGLEQMIQKVDAIGYKARPLPASHSTQVEVAPGVS